MEEQVNKKQEHKKIPALPFRIMGKSIAFILNHWVVFALICFLAFGGAYKFDLLDYFKKSGVTKINVTAKDYKQIDTVFTAFAYVPVIKFKDKIAIFGSEPDLADGYCLRRYEVSLGYENIYEIFKKFENSICGSGTSNQHITPKIISVNAISSEIYGSYSRSECDLLDKTMDDGLTEAKLEIAKYLNEKYMHQITKNSQGMLMAFLQNYCVSGDNNRNLEPKQTQKDINQEPKPQMSTQKPDLK